MSMIIKLREQRGPLGGAAMASAAGHGEHRGARSEIVGCSSSIRSLDKPVNK